ncbi:MAG: hypothetical protein U1F10_04215 [Burkholderiales bacterium]
MPALPNVDACSIDTRAVTLGGSTLSQYACGWRSRGPHDGIDTTRERIPSACSASLRLDGEGSHLAADMIRITCLRPRIRPAHAATATPAADA